MDVALYNKFGTFYRTEFSRLAGKPTNPLPPNLRAILIRECLRFQQVEVTDDSETVNRLSQRIGGSSKLYRYADSLLADARAAGEDI